MTMTTTVEPDAQTVSAELAGADAVDNGQRHRKTILAICLVGVIAAIAALAVILFPGMLAAAVAAAVVAVVVALDWLFSSRERQQAPLGYWTF